MKVEVKDFSVGQLIVLWLFLKNPILGIIKTVLTQRTLPNGKDIHLVKKDWGSSERLWYKDAFGQSD